MIAMRRSLHPNQWQQPDDLPDASSTRDDLLISRYVAALVTVARFAGCAAIILGGLTTVAWTRNFENIQRAFPHLAALNPFTALTFVCSGVALLLLQSRDPRR